MGIKSIFYFNILVLVFLIHKIDCGDKVPQIKLVGTQVRYINPEYHPSESAVVFTVRRINETSNYLTVFWDLKEDIPADIALYSKIFATDSTYQGGTVILDNVTPMCTENENRELLPNMFHVPKNLLNTQCMKKGTYQVDDVFQYRFEVLVPDVENLGSYFRAEHKVANENLTIGAVTFYSEWGYLNSN